MKACDCKIFKIFSLQENILIILTERIHEQNPKFEI
jgi:hypothetical protein